MTVKDLIEKLQEYPINSNLDVRLVGGGNKIVLVADGHELDPIFQFKNPPIHRGFGPREGCCCVSEYTQKLRAQFSDDLWVDHVNNILEDGKTHLNGRFTVTVYKNRYPDKSAREQFSAAFCPICGEKYPKAKVWWGSNESRESSA